MFGEWVQGDHLTLLKNPNYWQRGLPHVDQVTYRFLPDPQALVTQLEGGALDVAINPSLRDTVRYQSSLNYQVLFNDLAGDYFMLLVNCTRAPGDNKQFRQALNYALDRQRIASTVMLGLSRASDLPFNPKNVAFSETNNQFYSFDLDRAKALLAQAGVSNRVPAPTPFYNPQTNWAGFRSDALNQLAIAYSTEPDPSKAKAAIAAWTDYALDQSRAMPVVSSTPRAVMHPNVNGLSYTMNESLVAAGAWLA